VIYDEIDAYEYVYEAGARGEDEFFGEENEA